MDSFAVEVFSGMINNRNDDNIASVITKLAEKMNRKMEDEHGGVQYTGTINILITSHDLMLLLKVCFYNKML